MIQHQKRGLFYMPMPAKIGEILIKTTKSNDLDEALYKILEDYLHLKIKNLEEIIFNFQKKWGMDFDEYKSRIAQKTLKEDYSFECEKDFWEWEEAVTLKNHYEKIKNQWI